MSSEELSFRRFVKWPSPYSTIAEGISQMILAKFASPIALEICLTSFRPKCCELLKTALVIFLLVRILAPCLALKQSTISESNAEFESRNL